MSQDKKIIIVTGGAKGIGKAIVKALANNDTTIYFTYNNSFKEAQELIDSLKDFQVDFVKVDISDYEQSKAFIEEIIKKESKIDVLINNAGVTSDGLFLAMSVEKWQKVIDTNLTGTFFITKEVAKNMIKKRTGKIINISSIVSSQGNIGQSNYIASKAGIDGITRALALELAPRNITVNAVAPGFVVTDMTSNVLEKNSEKILSHIPLNRFANPEDIANVVDFLCSSKADYITGQVIVVDGGLSLGVH